MGIIRLLPETIANQIAAGEVVQRPASVVKELLENAIDAQARHIKLIVKNGGKDLIQVVDDGIGMDEVDARLSFERHATSKIRDTQDLFQIKTKGFRGEALASIAAVAHVEMKTRPHDRELGTYVRIEGGEFKQQEAIQTPAGTSVAVKNLFFNVPARRKFLKSAQVEMRHVIDEFQRVALAYPELEFTFIHNGKEVYKLFPSNLLQRIMSVFGKKIEERLLPVREETEYIKISGYVGKPEFAKLKRGEQFFFVNRRFIKSSYLHSAVMKAYEGILQEKKIPPYFLFFEIDPAHIDINIHPTKTEIKFDDEYTVYQILRASTRRALGQFNQMPSLDFDRIPELDFTHVRKSKNIPREPKIQVSRDFNPFKDTGPSRPSFNYNKPAKPEIDRMNQMLHQVHQEGLEFASKISGNTEMFDQHDVKGEIQSFQWAGKYIVSYIRSGLVVIHQHEAHLSVLYEEFFQKLSQGKIPSQQLMFPLEAEFLSEEIQLMEQHTDIFEKMGFEWEKQNEKILLTAIPSGLNESRSLEVIEQMISTIHDDLPPDFESVNRLLAYKLAEVSAVRSGQELSLDQRNDLIARLFSLPEPQFSPSGKRNFIILKENDIEKLF